MLEITVTNDDVELVWTEISRIGTCMMTTHDGAMIRARPMVGAADRSARTIWFVTNRAFHKDDELRTDPRVCLAYSDSQTDTFVSISGLATLSEDRGRIQELWNPTFDALFSDGATDADALLIAVRPELAEVWDCAHHDVLAALETLTLAGPQTPAGAYSGDSYKIRM